MNLKLLFFLSVVLPLSCFTQTLIPATYNPGITADGLVSGNEWAQSSSVTIASPGNNITYKVAYDSTMLYVLCYGKLESANVFFPELLLDVNNSKSAAWQNDDWWFHVSATDCESNGAYGVYNNCLAVQPDWTGSPNFVSGPPMTDTVEMAVKWSKINFNPFGGSDLGISLLVTNTFNNWKLWPTPADRTNPSTWGVLDFTVNTTSLPALPTIDNAIISPNPSSGNFNIDLGADFSGATLQIINLLGQEVHGEKIYGRHTEVLIAEKGVYQVLITHPGSKQFLHKKLYVH